jgi:hypothetical protein
MEMSCSAAGVNWFAALRAILKLPRQRAEADRTREPYAALVSLHSGMPDRARAQIREAISAAEASKEIVTMGAALTYACSL